MYNNLRNRKNLKTKNEVRDSKIPIIAAIIGGVAVVIAAIIAFWGNVYQAQLPINASQTAENRLTASALTYTAGIVPPTETPLLAPITNTFTPNPIPRDMPALTPSPPQLTSTPVCEIQNGHWSVRADHADDNNIILVNGHMVGVALVAQHTDWIIIDSLLRVDTPNYVVFVNLNTMREADWKFSICYDGKTEDAWNYKDQPIGENTISWKAIEILLPGNTWNEVNLKNPEKKPLGGSWTAQVRADDVGLLLVNGVPAAAGSIDKDGSHDYGGQIDISKLLYADQNNEVLALVWNSFDTSSWDFTVSNGEGIVWEAKDQGIENIGEVLFERMIIDGQGNIVPE